MTSWTDANVVCDRFPGVDPSVVVTEEMGIGVVVDAGNIDTSWEGVETSPVSVVGASLVTGYTDVVTSVTSSLGTIVVIPVSSSTLVATALATIDSVSTGSPLSVPLFLARKSRMAPWTLAAGTSPPTTTNEATTLPFLYFKMSTVSYRYPSPLRMSSNPCLSCVDRFLASVDDLLFNDSLKTSSGRVISPTTAFGAGTGKLPVGVRSSRLVAVTG